jgi:biotin carboxyl carrier protein
MSIFQFSNAPDVLHRVHTRADGVMVDGEALAVRSAGRGCFVTTIDGHSEPLRAVAHGDAVYVQLRGRAWRLEKLDPARSNAASGAGATGASLAPMPGVVVSLHAQLGQRVERGDPLLVIESMKLQMTVEAATQGTVVELPCAAGQTFARGAVLARVEAEGAAT